MPVIHAADAEVRDLHNARFTSYIRPATGSAELCLWRLEVRPGTGGQGHRILREEVFFVLSGTATLTVDDEATVLAPGDAAVVPAGSMLRIDNAGPEPAEFVVVAPVGFTGELPDGTTITPHWVS
ncbi:cupin domain-containing protein [Nocardia sp. alder85J]|uniref:cupin domain-containing protein n=1 Tax=Nocardia sp. alder85J TaxID=2862949 RepID=UPI001CD435D1|nr:cupin domain-containing protein [Nocardia sp. alder85J]MCX4097955.1 cupin domain-containing protein [Nocardia sp. alder85J]